MACGDTFKDAELPYAFALLVGSLTGLGVGASAPSAAPPPSAASCTQRWSGGRDFSQAASAGGPGAAAPVKIHP